MNKFEHQIDRFKNITLKRLQALGEENKSYEIDRDDLYFIDECMLCNSYETTLVTDVKYKNTFSFFSTRICNNCLFTYRSISPSLSWFKKCWKKIVLDNVQVFNPEMENIRSNEYEKYLHLIQKYISSGKILDIGSAYGSGAKFLQKNGYEVHCVEAEDNRANYIENNLNLPVVGRALEDFSSNEKYDAIVFSHCLEHLDNPCIVLPKIKNLLKPNGVLYLEVPILWNIVNWVESFYLPHKTYFTEENLKRLLIQNGFSVLDVVYQKRSPTDPVNMGLLLGLSNNHESNIFENRYIGDLNNAIDLFKINFPLSEFLTHGKKIEYNVDSIGHFYHTIRMDQNHLSYDSSRDQFVFIKND